VKTKELIFIRLSFLISSLICAAKFIAWYITGSLVILSDALESIINVAGAAFAWYSIYLSGKPRDREHPYGHGKVEFFSIGFEGALIFIAGMAILYESVMAFLHPSDVKDTGIGVWIVTGAGLANFLLGFFLVQQGKRYNSITLQGNGKHIMSDSYTSIGVLLALVLILLTGHQWIDPLASFVAGGIIIYTGFKLLRKAISGLMDEADPAVVDEIIRILKKNRRASWIDVHNLRVQRYGNFYHVDCHVTLPFYYSLNEVHDEISEMDRLLNEQFENGTIEFFIHTDPCLELSCTHCLLQECRQRRKPFVQQLEWTHENLLPNRKHAYPE
jgi:cation diffusion facilitator family transporter